MRSHDKGHWSYKISWWRTFFSHTRVCPWRWSKRRRRKKGMSTRVKIKMACSPFAHPWGLKGLFLVDVKIKESGVAVMGLSEVNMTIIHWFLWKKSSVLRFLRCFDDFNGIKLWSWVILWGYICGIKSLKWDQLNIAFMQKNWSWHLSAIGRGEQKYLTFLRYEVIYDLQ